MRMKRFETLDIEYHNVPFDIVLSRNCRIMGISIYRRNILVHLLASNEEEPETVRFDLYKDGDALITEHFDAEFVAMTTREQVAYYLYKLTPRRRDE